MHTKKKKVSIKRDKDPNRKDQDQFMIHQNKSQRTLQILTSPVLDQVQTHRGKAEGDGCLR